MESEAINIKIQRRQYHCKSNDLKVCPECGSALIEKSCEIMIHVETNKEQLEMRTNRSHSYFCVKCPVVIFDTDKIEQTVQLGIKGTKEFEFAIIGIIEPSVSYDEQKHYWLGTDENPIFALKFLPKLT